MLCPCVVKPRAQVALLTQPHRGWRYQKPRTEHTVLWESVWPLALTHILLRSGGPEGIAALGWEDILLSRPGFTVARLNSTRSPSTVHLVLALSRDLCKMGLGDWTQCRTGTSQSPLLEKQQPCLPLLPEDSWKEDEPNNLSLGWSPTSERVRLPREGP